MIIVLLPSRLKGEVALDYSCMLTRYGSNGDSFGLDSIIIGSL